MGKAIIDIIGSLVEITGNNIVDTILVTFLGVISLATAFYLVGVIFEELNFYDSKIMSCVHWIIRIVVFVVLFSLMLILANSIRWLFSLRFLDYLLH